MGLPAEWVSLYQHLLSEADQDPYLIAEMLMLPWKIISVNKWRWWMDAIHARACVKKNWRNNAKRPLQAVYQRMHQACVINLIRVRSDNGN